MNSAFVFYLRHFSVQRYYEDILLYYLPEAFLFDFCIEIYSPPADDFY